MNFLKNIYNSTKQTFVGSKVLYQESKQVNSFIRSHPDTSKWTRKDYLFVHRVKTDVRKSALFGLIFLILPEVIPLILARGINVMPSGFLTADQKLSIKKKLSQDRLDIAKKWISSFPNDLVSHSKIEPQYYLPTSFKRSELKEFAKLFNLGRFGTCSMIIKRISNHTSHLKMDDEYLKKMDLKDLTKEELESALDDRGISRNERTDSECLTLLQKWLDQNNNTGTDMILKVKTSMILNHN